MHKIHFTLPKVLLIFVSLKYQATVKLLSYRSDIFRKSLFADKGDIFILDTHKYYECKAKNNSLCLL